MLRRLVLILFCVCVTLAITDAAKGTGRKIDSYSARVMVDTPRSDSTGRRIEITPFGMHIVRPRPQAYLITELERARQEWYHESTHFMSFNRVTGFSMGLGTFGMTDLDTLGFIGVTTGVSYDFTPKRWEYEFGAELRWPLINLRSFVADTTRGRLAMPPTLGIGGEVHNITSTEDAWRVHKLENAMYAFFAREDFRDYFKLAGWNAYLALRPQKDNEVRVEWRHDSYSSLGQEVWGGRFGGSKQLPPNPSIQEGYMNSLVITSREETVHPHISTVMDLVGDSTTVEQLQGMSSMLQIELGHMPASDFGFNRYVLDSRRFTPILSGLSFDTRFRFEALTGDRLRQKLSFLGGPGALAGIKNKTLVGNRMMLLNTEIRFSPGVLSKRLYMPDLNLVLYNDFGKISLTPEESILKGWGFNGISSILYDVGIGIGWTRGIQFGIMWRTDIKDDPRIHFRLERPF